MKRLIALLAVLLVPMVCSAQNPIKMTIRNHTSQVGSVVDIGVELFSTSQNSTDLVKFSVSFDPSKLTFIAASRGPALEIWTDNNPPLTFIENGSALSLGVIGVTAQVPPNFYGLSPGSLQLIANIRFVATTATPSTPVRFGDFPVTRQTAVIISGTPVSQGTDYVDGEVTVLSPGTARKVRIPDGTYGNLLPVAIPIEIEAKGNENAIAFSLVFDITRMGYRGVSLGVDASSASLIINSGAFGPVGVLLTLPPGQTFPQGLRHVVNVHFQIFERDGPTSFYFTDSPVPRELVSVTAASLPVYFELPTITFQQGLEGDAAPRPYGNHSVSLADWVQVGRYAAGLDVVGTDWGEFQRVDCAPLATGGDGRISLADYVQAGRFAAQLDAIRQISGPYSPSAGVSPDESALPSAVQARSRLPEHTRSVLLTPVPSRKGDVTYAVELRGEGDENAVSFSLEYTGSMKLVSAEPDDPGTTFHVNQSVPGKIGIVLAMPPGQGLSRRLLTLKLEGEGHVRFADGPVAAELVTVDAETVGVVFSQMAHQRLAREAKE